MLITQKLVMTKDIGCNDNLYGGNLLSWFDEAGAIYAKTATKEERMVTFKLSEMVFKKPIKVGSIVTFNEENTVRGTSSISFKLKATVGQEDVAEVDCIYVCVDAKGNKKPIAIFNIKSLQAPLDKTADNLTKIMYYCPASIEVKSPYAIMDNSSKEYKTMNIYELLCTQSWDWLARCVPEFDSSELNNPIDDGSIRVWELNQKRFLLIERNNIKGYGLSSYNGMIYFR